MSSTTDGISDATRATLPVREWFYSAKAMRWEAVRNGIVSLAILAALLVASSVMRHSTGAIAKAAEAVESQAGSASLPPVTKETASGAVGWAIVVLRLMVLVALAVIWGSFAYQYRYRTKTFRYTMTATKVNVTKGFDPEQKSIDLVNIEDISLERSMIDKLVNGGVGNVTISAGGKGNKTKTYVLVLQGLEDAEDVYGAINNARIQVRAREGIATVRGV